MILLHAALGVAIYLLPFLSKIYGFLILFLSLYFIVKTKNRNNEVLYASAYVVGVEVFLRMTGGNPNHEFSKYSVIVFLAIGMVYSGISKNAIPYWIYLILLLPGVYIATQSISLDAPNIRKTIMFNISGAFCLGVASLYCYNRKFSFEEINNLLLLMGLPIISCAVYLVLYTPELKEVVTSTGSNSETSGGFGPNQVATALGLGMFIFFARMIVASRNKTFLLINLLVGILMLYRGLLTFSRGGMITGFLMIIVFFGFLYVYSRNIGKLKLIYIVGFIFILLASTWAYTESQTGGLISKRYANQDATGRVKDSQLTGREDLAMGEIEMFLENPFFGVGAGKGTEIRSETMGYLVASHDELTRILAEHGSLGILSLLILIFTPIFLYLDNKQHIYMLCFLVFWFLTINHAAMRTASPAFIYALSLLKIKFNYDEEDSVHRK
ncbi:O-antigen ligase family protein [Flavobacterium sp.]|uniref:O-antigen ligase family protein n=1 Tax=Flavobacterium sp. TaxID=239 RepID=UPI00345D94A3